MSMKEIQMPGLPPVKVVRRKRQRTIRIRVKNEEIVISGPATVSHRRLQDFVQEKKEWIRRTCERQERRSHELRLQREALKGTMLLRGERKPICDFPVPQIKKPRLVEHNQAVIYQYDPVLHGNHAAINGFEDESILPQPELMLSFYKKLAQKELSERYEYWRNQLPFQPSRLTIRNQKTKWGSCSTRGTISLNWRLVKCPADIADYIIIHELCHLRHFNHSPAFWKTVTKYYPQVKQARSWIRLHSDEIFSDF